jgi:O-antigen ligase
VDGDEGAFLMMSNPLQQKLVVGALALTLILSGFYALPLAGVVALLIAACFSLHAPPRSLRVLSILLVLTLLWWAGALLISSGASDDLFSFRFIRWQVRGFAGYLPLLALLFSRPYIRGRGLSMLVACLLMPAVIIVAVGGLQYILDMDTMNASRYSTVRFELGSYWFFGFFRGHVACGGYYAIVSLVAISTLLFWRCGRWTRFGLFVVATACMWGLMFSMARGFLVAFGVSLAWMIVYALVRCWVAPPDTRRLSSTLWHCGLVLAALFLAYLLVPGLHPRVAATVARLFHAETTTQREPQVARVAMGTMDSRTVLWRSAINMFKSSPILGVGMGRFEEAYKAQALAAGNLRVIDEDLVGIHAHNSWLHFAAETGIVGVGLVMSLWGAIVLGLFRSLQRHEFDSLSMAFCVAASGVVMAQLIQSVVDHGLWSPQLMIPTTLLAGVAMMLPPTKPEVVKSEQSSCESPIQNEHE